jgi:hypothetical protein
MRVHAVSPLLVVVAVLATVMAALALIMLQAADGPRRRHAASWLVASSLLVIAIAVFRFRALA